MPLLCKVSQSKDLKFALEGLTKWFESMNPNQHYIFFESEAFHYLIKNLYEHLNTFNNDILLSHFLTISFNISNELSVKITTLLRSLLMNIQNASNQDTSRLLEEVKNILTQFFYLHYTSINYSQNLHMESIYIYIYLIDILSNDIMQKFNTDIRDQFKERDLNCEYLSILCICIYLINRYSIKFIIKCKYPTY